MSKKLLIGFGTAAVLFVPALAFAQSLGQLGSVVTQSGTLVQQANTVLNYIIGALITIAIIVFIFNVIRFVLKDNPEEKKQARSYMFISVIAIAVILGIFGIARFLLGTFGIGSGGLTQQEIPSVPTAPTQSSYSQ